MDISMFSPPYESKVMTKSAKETYLDLCLHHHQHHDTDHPPGQQRQRARDEQPFQDVHSGRQKSHLRHNIVQVAFPVIIIIII